MRKPGPMFSLSRRRSRATEMERIVERASAGGCRLLANMVEGGGTPQVAAGNWRPSATPWSSSPAAWSGPCAKMAQDYFASLQSNGTNLPFRDRMLDLQGLNELLGTDELSWPRARPTTATTSGPAMIDPVTLAVLDRASGADRRRDGCHAVPLRLQSHHCRGARRLPRALSRRERRDPGPRKVRACRSSSAPCPSRSSR